MSAMRRFSLVRTEDVSGMSGTGAVAEGVQFSTGECVLNWLTASRSQAFYVNLATLELIHGHGGRTRVEFIDAAPEPTPNRRKRVMRSGAPKRRSTKVKP